MTGIDESKSAAVSVSASVVTLLLFVVGVGVMGELVVVGGRLM